MPQGRQKVLSAAPKWPWPASGGLSGFLKGCLQPHLILPWQNPKTPKQKVTLICLSSLSEEVTAGVSAQTSGFWSIALATLIALTLYKSEGLWV